jgi:hypothetical protein
MGEGSNGAKWRTTPEGVLELVDAEGRVLERQKVRPGSIRDKIRKTSGKPRGRPRKLHDHTQTHHWVMDGNGRKHWLPKGTDPDTLPRKVYPYCQTTADLICQFILEGKTIPQIASLDGIPPLHIIYKWRTKYPEFTAALDEAIKNRAHLLAEMTLHKADEVEEDNVQKIKLQTEIYKWGSSVGDPDRFGARVKHAGDATQPLTFIIDTGIREALPEPKDVPALASTPAAQIEADPE